MTEVLIVSDFSDFEENIFIVSQAQRFFLHVSLAYPDLGEWTKEYLYHIYLDSWNNEFKSFYLESDDGYISNSLPERARLLRVLFQKSTDMLLSIEYADFLNILLEEICFDRDDNDITKEDIRNFFLPYFDRPLSEQRAAKQRVANIFLNLIQLIDPYIKTQSTIIGVSS